MKKLLLLLFLAAAAYAAAPEPAEKLVRIQSDVTPAGEVTAFFEKSVSLGGAIYTLPWESVTWKGAEQTVTVAGKTMTYGEVMAFVIAIAHQERSAQQASPPPAQ